MLHYQLQIVKFLLFYVWLIKGDLLCLPNIKPQKPIHESQQPNSNLLSNKHVFIGPNKKRDYR
jgi:hypothetical protein